MNNATSAQTQQYRQWYLLTLTQLVMLTGTPQSRCTKSMVLVSTQTSHQSGVGIIIREHAIITSNWSWNNHVNLLSTQNSRDINLELE